MLIIVSNDDKDTGWQSRSLDQQLLVTMSLKMAINPCMLQWSCSAVAAVELHRAAAAGVLSEVLVRKMKSEEGSPEVREWAGASLG